MTVAEIPVDNVPGDLLGMVMPSRAEDLRAAGVEFLTKAFRKTGSLPADNSVTRITQLEESPGGSTGRKLLLSVEYEKPSPELHTDLFVKFSRDYDDALRDGAKIQMSLEAKFALLSRAPGFPIRVPVCYYSDYHEATGTGVMITERIAFGKNGVERHREKCLDYQMPEALGHYKALIKANARLAGMHKAGRLPAKITEQFPFEPDRLTVSHRAPYNAKQLQNRVARYSDFAAKYPQILPDNIRSPEFIAKLSEEVARFPDHIAGIKLFLQSNPDLIALSHWNANIDNAWFWHDAEGQIRCGLLDWGQASQMNVAMAIWGCMSGAELDLWNNHFDELLALYVEEFRSCGGPAIDAEEIKMHLELYVASMGLAYLLDAPPLILRHIPDLEEVKDRFDYRFETRERARTQIQMMSSFMNLWQRLDFGKALDEYLRRTQGGLSQP